jgi:hypothetical protein
MRLVKNVAGSSIVVVPASPDYDVSHLLYASGLVFLVRFSFFHVTRNLVRHYMHNG